MSRHLVGFAHIIAFATIDYDNSPLLSQLDPAWNRSDLFCARQAKRNQPFEQILSLRKKTPRCVHDMNSQQNMIIRDGLSR